MASVWQRITAIADAFAPEHSPKRKLLQILGIILVFEGLSVLILFSYVGLLVGVLSIVVGIVLMVLLQSRVEPAKAPEAESTPGIRLLDYFIRLLGGDYVVVALGSLLIVLVLLYNRYISPRPELGDFDTLSIMFGGMLVVYPFLVRKFKIEAGFSLLFLGLVVVFLVLPPAVSAISPSNSTSTVGNWYVHYMLAAPFAGVLDLIGIPASSSGNSVTIQFNDGTLQTLGISAYCAGMYSFSIFLAAFFAFVLVFERLPTRILVIVLALGLLVAYLGNLFRMVFIGIVGYYRGIDALLWAHENVGWIVFLSWSVVFWYLLLGYISKQGKIETETSEDD